MPVHASENLGEHYTAYDLIGAVAQSIEGTEVNDYRLVGGFPTAIMLDSATAFERETQTIKAGGSELPLVRDNGTKKDVDLVAMTDDSSYARELERELCAEFKPFGHTVSVDRLREPGVRRLGFVGSQVIDEKGKAYMQLGPVQQEVPRETLAAWHMVLPNGRAVNVWPPLTQLMMYEARSLTGVRAKDTTKRAELRERLLGVDELAADYDLYEPWMEYIRAVHELDLKNVFPLRAESGVIALNGFAKRVVAWGESKKEIVEAFQQDKGIVDKVQRWGINR